MSNVCRVLVAGVIIGGDLAVLVWLFWSWGASW
jgi:hypothetical protein